jgi:mannonate dehydratase
MKSKIKLSMMIDSDPESDQITFAKQLGIDHVYTWVKPDQRTSTYLIHLKQRLLKEGLTLYNAGDYSLGKSDKIHLGLPGRDEMIEQFKEFIRNLGKAGIGVTTFTWEPTQVWSSENGESRGAQARRVDLEEMKKRPLTHGREYTREELWENFEYFIKQVIPVAESAGVKLALHPNDPPVESLGGIPCLIRSYEDYKRAFAIADSPHLGMEFCTGCWLEGGDDFGDMFRAIKEFQDQGKILVVHFRNITGPLPTFVETFLDNGYMDMYRVMKTFVEVGYQGTMILDHSPKFVGAYNQGGSTAYAIGYMRAMIERAEAELS